MSSVQSSECQNSKLEEVYRALQSGKPIVIFDPLREGEADFALPGECCTPEGINTMLTFGKGLVCVALGHERARQKGVKRLETNHKDKYSTPFGMPIGATAVTTGISASDRAETILKLSDNSSTIHDFTFPGHVHTLIEHKGGLKEREGHTEAILSLLRHFSFTDCGVLCEILNKQGDVANAHEINAIAEMIGTIVIDIRYIAKLQCKESFVE